MLRVVKNRRAAVVNGSGFLSKNATRVMTRNHTRENKNKVHRFIKLRMILVRWYVDLESSRVTVCVSASIQSLITRARSGE